MSSSTEFLHPSQAARRLGVSAKALRLYEERRLVMPLRTSAGWRAYGPDELAKAAEIVALRALGLSLAQVAQVLGGEATGLEPALAAHQSALEERIGQLAVTVEKVRGLRADLARGQAPAAGVGFDLPWPWGGEWFELGEVRPLNYLTGPLGCGKTRLALRLAEALQGAAFLGLERAVEGAAAARRRLDADAALRARVEDALAWLVEEGAAMSDALLALVVELEAEGPAVLVVDMVEQGLDEATQAALISRLRRRGPRARPLFLMTRSNVILDLGEVGADEAIIYCPANHSPPIHVAPHPGAPGYEALATCLASPEVRARTEGMRAQMPEPA
ncbi:MAG TPA: MerR family transcriptional regulator [Caulobacteraceae bacterium]|nr:MerR family transcriptional regulator [Caulobacteraceae bacterium]